MCGGRPHLLAVEQPTAFDLVGAKLHVGRVRAGFGLRVADRELDIRVEHHRQELLLELLVAMPNQGLPDDADALADLGCGVLREGLVQDVLVDALDLLPAVFLGPGHPEPALRGELLHERAAFRRVAELAEVLAVVIHDDGVVVLDEPGFDLVGEFLFFGGEIKIHGGTPR